MPGLNDQWSAVQVRDWFTTLPKQEFVGQKVLLVIPPRTSSTALPLVFDAFFQEFRPHCWTVDVIVALGDQPPMSETQISEALGIEHHERRRLFYQLQLFNHEWDRNDRLLTLGKLTSSEVAELTMGRLSREIEVQVNSRIRDYDLLVTLGPVSSDEVVGLTGGNDLLFPGLAGPDIINALSQVRDSVSEATSSSNAAQPIQSLVDAAAAMIPCARRTINFVISEDGHVQGLFSKHAENNFAGR